jgi:hypothetical protein
MGLDSQNLDLQYEKNTKPLVAVWMVTYNHESYIAQAIESILLQKTNYDFKIYRLPTYLPFLLDYRNKETINKNINT